MTEWQIVENFCEAIEHLNRILGFNFALEAVHLIHVDALVVTFKYNEIVGFILVNVDI